MRRFSKTVTLMGLFAPLGANALGVGDVKMHSALNQALDAEIPLVISGSEALSDIHVQLAPPEAFSRAGLERHYSLTKLRFNPAQKPDGSLVIQVSSSEVIREPFLNFLVEVNWPQGRMLKEFTVLLDPPKALQATPEAGKGPELKEKPVAPATELVIAPAERNPAKRYPSHVASLSAQPDEYGPVRRHDTLSGIAQQISHDPAISPMQMAVALFRHNPQAFIENDINALKTGARLNIPEPTAISRISQREAREEFYRADGRRGGKPEQSEAQLKLLAPPDLQTKARGEIGQDASAKSKSDTALEVADTVRQENEEIRSRLASLEQQLAVMQRVITLKDEQIATLQGQQAKEGQMQTTPETEIASKLAQAARTAAPARPEAQKSTQQQIVAPSKTDAPQRVTRQSEAAPTAREEENSFLADLLSEPYYLAVAGGGLSLIGLLAWIWRGKRRTVLHEPESILILNDKEKAKFDATVVPSFGNASSEPLQNIAKSSFLSEFTSTDFGLDAAADEVDPISEADVYLAYGRYKQAEDLIRSAIQQDPDRDVCKLKLLEIHYATKNKTAFATYARELAEQNRHADAAFWGKVLAMGRELCPENSLFSTAEDTIISPAQAERGKVGAPRIQNPQALAVPPDAQFMDDLPKNFRKVDIEDKQSQTDTDFLLDFEDFEIGPAESLPPSESKTDPTEDSKPLDLESQAPSQVKPEALASYRLENLIPFEAARGRLMPLKEKPHLPITLPQKDKTIDVILRELTGELPNGRPANDLNPSTESGQRADPNDEFDFELKLLPPDNPEQNEQDSIDANNAYLDLPEANDLETKLDVAKAYVDMRDEESARGILGDILTKGDEKQKKRAQLLLDRLTQQRSA